MMLLAVCLALLSEPQSPAVAKLNVVAGGGGGGGGGVTVGITVTLCTAVLDLRWLSVTVNVNDNVVLAGRFEGAVNVALAVLAPVSTTGGLPPVCVHANVNWSPTSGSRLALPSRVTGDPPSTIWSWPG